MTPLSRFGKHRAKSSDSGRLSAQERKTPTGELYGSSRATPVGELEEAGRQEEAQQRMVAEQARIQQHYRRLVQQRQESEQQGGRELVEEVYSGHQEARGLPGHQENIYQENRYQDARHQEGRSHQEGRGHQEHRGHQENALPASLAAARPGSRSGELEIHRSESDVVPPGITGSATDPRFANYEEIQRHLSRRQAQHRWAVEATARNTIFCYFFRFISTSLSRYSQRREHPARSERPVSNFYEVTPRFGLVWFGLG